MSASLSNNSLRLSSPLKVEEEAHLIHKQGIVSILRSDCERSKVMSLRRTLSADMSKWLAHDDHHHHPMKKIASSQQFPILSTPPDSSSEEEEDDWSNHHLERRSQSDVWRSIQKEKERKEMEKVGQFDIWSSILCQKAEEDSAKLSLPPPYIHPLVKRSSSSLTEKSLEICTESLGSETGADGFSSYSASEIGDTEDEGDQVVSSRPQPHQQSGEERESLSFDRDEYRGLKYNRKFPPPLRSFPPPLPSLSSCNTSLHMHSRRENGRLVLEAVSVPSRNCFRAQRQDGRLLLTLVNSPSQEPIHDNHEEAIDQEEDKVEEFEEVFENEAEIRSEEDYEEEDDDDDDDDDEDEDEEEEEMVEKENGGNEMGIVIEQGVPKLLSGVINVHRSAPMMKKLMGIENRINSPWGTPKFNKSVNLMGMDVEEDEEEEVANPLPQSLPPPTRVARLIRTPPAAVTATSFNAYEYFWRTKPAGVATMMGPLTQPCPPLKNSCNKVILSNSSPKAYRQQDLVLYRGNKSDCLVPSLGSGCKEPKRSLLIWEPYCIATS